MASRTAAKVEPVSTRVLPTTVARAMSPIFGALARGPGTQSTDAIEVGTCTRVSKRFNAMQATHERGLGEPYHMRLS
jgi:hypothetical protein